MASLYSQGSETGGGGLSPGQRMMVCGVLSPPCLLGFSEAPPRVPPPVGMGVRRPAGFGHLFLPGFGLESWHLEPFWQLEKSGSLSPKTSTLRRTAYVWDVIQVTQRGNRERAEWVLSERGSMPIPS